MDFDFFFHPPLLVYVLVFPKNPTLMFILASSAIREMRLSKQTKNIRVDSDLFFVFCQLIRWAAQIKHKMIIFSNCFFATTQDSH